MRISKFRNKYYVLEAEEGKVITTILDPPEGEQRLYSRKIYLGKWDKVENYKEIDESEMEVEPEKRPEKPGEDEGEK